MIKQVLRRIPGAEKTFRVYRRWFDYYRLRRQKPLRVVVGAGGRYDLGWIPTDLPMLDITKSADWAWYFSPNFIDAILAEHVWEHLTESDGLAAAKLCFHYLKPSGYLRIAVPDGLHPSQDYIDWVKVGGVGPGAEDHKVLYTYQTCKALFESAGFQVRLYEYFDENGNFHFENWDTEDGKIHRSKRFDTRNQDGNPNYTSIILDAVKQS